MQSKSPALAYAYTQLDGRQQDMPFHAGEIYLQSLTAMLYADFDFKNTLIFLINYGRDNDTTASLAGGILGAWYGYNALPVSEREKVVRVTREELGIDLEKQAERLTHHLLAQEKK
jgi:ADP-ribosylglycohydrolase